MNALRRFNTESEDYTYEEDERTDLYEEDDRYEENNEDEVKPASELIMDFFNEAKNNLLSLFSKERKDAEYEEIQETEEENEESEDVREEKRELKEYDGETAEDDLREENEEEVEKREDRRAEAAVKKYKKNESKEDDEVYTYGDIQKYKNKFGVYGYTVNDRKKTRKRTIGENIDEVSSPEWNYRGNVNKLIEVVPSNYEDLEEVANILRKDNAVIMNLKKMGKDRYGTIRFFDGVCYMLKYRFERIGNEDYYLAVPKGYMYKIDLGAYTGKKNRK